MRTKIIVIIAMAISLIWVTTSNAGNSNQEKVIGSRIPAQLDVIKNFEDWNDVLIRIVGYMPNGCFNKEGTKARVVNGKILIDNYVEFSPQNMCTMAMVPYLDKVPVRDLNSGKYEVAVKDRFGNYVTLTQLNIK